MNYNVDCIKTPCKFLNCMQQLYDKTIITKNDIVILLNHYKDCCILDITIRNKDTICHILHNLNYLKNNRCS